MNCPFHLPTGSWNVTMQSFTSWIHFNLHTHKHLIFLILDHGCVQHFPGNNVHYSELPWNWEGNKSGLVTTHWLLYKLTNWCISRLTFPPACLFIPIHNNRKYNVKETTLLQSRKISWDFATLSRRQILPRVLRQ